MSRQILARIAFLLLAVCGAQLAVAQVIIPPLAARVTDQTATLNSEQIATLEQRLAAFELRKGSQLAVLIVPTTSSETIEQYALRVVEQWKLGRKKVDDGALLIIAKDDRTVRIEVGYGLEGALTDATSKRIISELLVPHFKEGDFYGGIAAAVEQMIRVVDGEALPAPKPTSTAGTMANFEEAMPMLFVAALVIGGVLRAVLGKFLGAVAAGAVVGVVAWFVIGALSLAVFAGVIAFFFTLTGVGAGGMGGMRGLGGGRGGFGGGGGGFGGGGASGRW